VTDAKFSAVEHSMDTILTKIEAILDSLVKKNPLIQSCKFVGFE